jgi:hypothetical protein
VGLDVKVDGPVVEEEIATSVEEDRMELVGDSSGIEIAG